MMPLLMPELQLKANTQRNPPPNPLQTHMVLLLKPPLQRPLSPSKAEPLFFGVYLLEKYTFDV